MSIFETLGSLGQPHNYELIMFRRTGRGQLDISPSIRHDVQANVDLGIWNNKIVILFSLVLVVRARQAAPPCRERDL